MEVDQNFTSLFNASDKKSVLKICRSIKLKHEDLVNLIMNARFGHLEPYIYAVTFLRRNPVHLSLSENDIKALHENGARPFNQPAQIAASKIFQAFEERRHLVAHLFYTQDDLYWHLLYFDQRDVAENINHWQHGPHLHYLSNLLTDKSLSEIWDMVQNGKMDFGSKAYIRFALIGVAD